MILRLIQWVRESVQGKKPQISRGEVLNALPIRNRAIEWTREVRDAEDPEAKPVVVLKIPRRSDKFGNVMARLFRVPDFRKLELDELGSDVWEMCDGTNSVEEITRALVLKYHLNRRQAETSVTAYLKMLAERRLIGLKASTPASAAAKKSGKSVRAGTKKQKRA